jgi:hypothetical protein
LCHDHGPEVTADWQQPPRKEWLALIERDGWFPFFADEMHPSWMFTIGLWHTHRAPELAVSGLDADVMVDMLRSLADEQAEGTPLRDGDHREPLRLHAVRQRDRFGPLDAFYRGDRIPILQIAWPNPAQESL